MSGYTSGNSAPTLMAQSPNRKGNMSKHTPSNVGGVTAVTRAAGGLAQPKGSQGAPKAGGNITGMHQKVQVSRPQESCGCNDSYMSKSVKNY